MLNFFTLEKKFGSPAAHQYLHEIEKAARICSADVAMLDPDLRLMNAIRAQDHQELAA
jgi:hypothetical protein